MIEKLLNLTISTSARRGDGSTVTLYRGLALPAGVEAFVVVDSRTGVERDGTTVGSVALKIFREVFALAPAPAQIESPLPAAERRCSGLARGATLTMPTEPQARVMAITVKWTREGAPLQIFRSKRCDLRMLRALARRGWLELNHPIRPTYGTLTDAGRKALAAYEAKYGTPADVR
jgi:hypothetical protein